MIYPTRLLIYAIVWLLTSTMHVAIAQDRSEDELLLITAFVYNFSEFTRWPENTWEEQEAPLTLCTAGKDEMIDKLMRLNGRTIKGHPIALWSIEDTQVPGNCQILYIATSEQGHYKEIIQSLRDRPVLTVSELPRFGRSGGIIELYREQERIRFTINLGVARKAGLVLSSRLLSLATVINHEDAP